MKTRMNFRLSEVALASMATLMGRWGLDRTGTIERALAIAAAETEPKILPNDPKEVAKVVAKKPTPAPLGKPMTTLTREEREARIDAFQRKTGMGTTRK